MTSQAAGSEQFMSETTGRGAPQVHAQHHRAAEALAQAAGLLRLHPVRE